MALSGKTPLLDRAGFRILLLVTLTVLLLSLPSSFRYLQTNRGLYLFSRAFVDDIPKRLTGAGRLRFIVQPLVSIVLGIRNGIADAKANRPPYVSGILFHRDRLNLLKSGYMTLANILLMGILIDSICQWLIIHDSYLGAALVVGPVLIAAPYTIARTLTNRLASFTFKR